MKNLLKPSLAAILALSINASCAAQDQPVSEAPEATTEAQQAPSNFPETDIFLFDFDANASANALSQGRNVTDRVGYDNQPYFTKDSDSFVYSRDDGVQTDIYEYALKNDTHKRLTNSDKSEFSPTPSPDNTKISFVFERNNSIWHADRGQENDPRWSLETAGVEEPVGYFARNYKTGDILFWSRYGYNVTLTNAEKQAYHYVAGNAVPATPYIIPGTDNFSFVHRQANGTVWIKELNPTTKAVRPLTPIVGTNANYTWAPDGSIIQIENNTVHKWREGTENGWIEIADLSKLGIKNANRVAVSPNGKKIAIVGVPEEGGD